jgi:integrase
LSGAFATGCYVASIYLRKDSRFCWIRLKRPDGTWESKATQYLKDNIGDRRQADLMARRASIEERENTPASQREHFDAWVDAWMKDRYGGTDGTTLVVYQRHWRRLRDWMKSVQITSPAQISYKGALEYKTARLKDGVSINTVIHELKFLSVVMGEAVHRDFAKANPVMKMGLKRAAITPKTPWTDEESVAVAGAIHAQSDFLQASFILGFYQAARLRQCEVPLRDINLSTNRITYWRSLSGRPLTKGDKPFTQPISQAALPLLRDLIDRRKAAGKKDLCEIPAVPSMEWRAFLDQFGFSHLCHHGLRTTWVTRAASSGEISRAQAMRFVNHGSTAVHEIYQRLNADDVAHVADALHLPAFAAVQRPSA